MVDCACMVCESEVDGWKEKEMEGMIEKALKTGEWNQNAPET